jgi:hypothetical protein
MILPLLVISSAVIECKVWQVKGRKLIEDQVMILFDRNVSQLETQDFLPANSILVLAMLICRTDLIGFE